MAFPCMSLVVMRPASLFQTRVFMSAKIGWMPKVCNQCLLPDQMSQANTVWMSAPRVAAKVCKLTSATAKPVQSVATRRGRPADHQGMGGVALAHLRHWAKTIVIVTDFTNFTYVDVTDFANFASFTHTVLQYWVWRRPK